MKLYSISQYTLTAIPSCAEAMIFPQKRALAALAYVFEATKSTVVATRSSAL